MEKSEIERAQDAARANGTRLSDLVKSTQRFTEAARIADQFTKLPVGLTEAARIANSIPTWPKAIDDQFLAASRIATSPAIEQLNDIIKRIQPAESATPVLFNRDRASVIPHNPVIDMHHSMARDAKARRAREEEQIGLLREMADTAKVAVATAERNEAIALGDAAAMRKTARNARIVALLSALVTVIVSWETVQKFFFFIVEKVL